MPESKPIKITVLMQPIEFDRLDAYCKEMGYKKSPLVARLIRDFLNSEGVNLQNQTNSEHERAQ